MTNILIKDGGNNTRYIASGGAGTSGDPFIPINDVRKQDQYTPIIDYYFMRHDDTFTLSSGVSIDDRTFTATAGHSLEEDQVVCFKEGTRFFQAEVLSVDTNTITIDCPFDFAFTTSADGCNGVYNMAVDGSVTPQIFSVSPKDMASGVEWDVTRLLISITDESSMDDSKFGGISALTNGILLRKKDGEYYNIFNVKDNGEFALRTFDATYATKAPAGFYGLRVRRSFNGDDKNGVTIRLTADGDDELQIIIQDDLTGLETFKAVAQGHYTD